MAIKRKVTSKIRKKVRKNRYIFRAVAVERDQLKEQLAQLERDNQQLSFERETLLYSLRQRSTTISYMPILKPRPTETRQNRTRSLLCLIKTATENERFKRSSSVDCIL